MTSFRPDPQAGAEDRSPDAVGEMIRRAGPPTAPDAERSARVEEAVRAAWKDSLPKQRPRRWPWGIAAAAAVGLIAYSGWNYWSAEQPHPIGTVQLARGTVRIGESALQSGDRLLSGAVLSTGPDGAASLLLDTKIALRLDKDSELELIDRRTLTMTRGRLYVDTGPLARASADHIHIDTPFGAVEDIGTQFELRLSADGARIRVREGFVRLASGNRVTQIERGSERTVGAGGATEPSPLSPSSDEWNWSTTLAPPFEVEGARFDLFLQWAARELGLELDFARAETRRATEGVLLHGTIQGMTPEQALQAVVVTTGFVVERKDGQLLVTRPAQSDESGKKRDAAH